ncbi:PREDICTED: putative ribonuclease H protein At1g65750-like [Fragaria vesca subsp. vesca]
MSECKRLKEILSIYEVASRQKINYGKSAISFSPSTSEEEKILLSNEMGMKLVAYHEKYLGLPTFLGRDKGKILRKVRERVKNRVEGWHSNLLSLAGKEVLVKAVLQAVPTYSMSVFKLPLGLCDELNAVVAKFWWGKKGGRGVHWKKWQFLCKAKECGGLGFREFGKFNQAMVGKQA